MSGPSSLPIEDKLKLESWGLPKYILEKYWSKGLDSMFPWQLECLTAGNVLNGGNLVYSAPTSAGKTLVAEILTIQTVLERKKKVIIILPFVSVVREKMLYFQDLLTGSGIRVGGFMGSHNPPGGFRAVHVAICTIEKANSLINRLLEENNFDNIGCVVVDELHLLGDPHRGYLLELLLTKLKYVSKKGLCPPIQIVGMSATLPNLEVLSNWLDATLYKTDFRPIPLIEYIKIDRSIHRATDLSSKESFDPEFSIDNDPGDVIYLCVDTILKGYSVLVFCPTKNWCETLALQIAGEVKKLGCSSGTFAGAIREQLNSEAISDTLQQLKNCPVGMETVLGKCVSFGVAYHHAGLTLDERDIVEGGFRQSVLRVLVATSTLSSGVNLPARRVIIRSPLFSGRMMDILTYKQMVGRAGRMGKDTAGESFLLCTEEQMAVGQRLVTSELPTVESCLGHSDLSSSLKRAVLEVVASGLIKSCEEVKCYTNCTLLAAYEDPEKINEAVQKCLKYLTNKGFIQLKNDTDILVSSLAEACLSASMTPDQGLALLAELDKARKCFVLDSDLHAVYQVTPFSVSNQWSIDWMKAFSMWEALPTNVKKVGELVGIDERFLIKAMRGNMNFQAENQAHRVAVHKRFFTALALQDLINEIPLNKVAEKYGCNKGVLQSLQQSASTFSGMVTNFCRKLSWGAMEVVVSQLGQRIQFGAHRDLLDLLRLECMTGAMARGLYNSGVTSVSELAQSSANQICTAIRKTLPFASSEDATKRSERRDVHLPGRPGLTEYEAALLFIREARSFLMREMGIDCVDWNETKTSSKEEETPSRIEESEDSSLNLSVSTADFQKMDVDHKIGLSGNKESTSTKLPPGVEPLETVGDSCSANLSKSVIDPVRDGNTTARDSSSGMKKDESSDDEDVDEVVKFSRLSSLLDISNPCIPKVDCNVNSSPSTSDSDSELDAPLSEDVVPTSQQMQPTQFIIERITQTHPRNESLSKVVKVANNSSNNVLNSTSVSKAFQSSFVRDSPIEEKNLMLLKSNYGIKSSTPISTPECKSDVDTTNRDSKKLGSVSSILGITSVKDISFRTPESRFSDVKRGDDIKISPAISEVSDADMFSDSVTGEGRLSFSMLCAIHSNQPLEELDSNMGGDSILLASQVIETQKDKIVESFSQTGRKRNLESIDTSRGRPFKKRCTLSLRKSCAEPSPVVSSGISNYFTESLVLDTQAINVADDNSGPITVFPAESNRIEPVKSPSAHREAKCTVNPGRSSLTDSYLADAFQDSFKPGEQSLDPGTPEMFGSLVDATVISKESSKPLLREGISTSDNPSHFKTSIERLAIPSSSSPLKHLSVSKSPSPSKYPSVGVSFIKCSKSPISPVHSKKKPSPESVTGKSCKKLLLPSTAEANCSKVDLPLAEPLPPDQIPTTSKTIKKAHSMKWGKHEPPPVDDNFITSDEKELSSAPVALSNDDSPDFSQHGTFTTTNSLIKVCNDVSSVKRLRTELAKCRIAAFCLETINCSSNDNKIGMRIMSSKKEKNPDFHFNNIGIIGVYIFMKNEIFHCCLRSSRCICIDTVKSIFQSRDMTMVGFDLFWQLKLLYQCLDVSVECGLWDVSVADWLLNPQDEKKPLKQLSKEYLSAEDLVLVNRQKSQCAADSLMIWLIKQKLSSKLVEAGLLQPFVETEMPIRLLLMYMELSGMPFDQKVATQLWNRVRETMTELEEQIYTKARRRFSLSSRKDLKKVKETLNIKPDDTQNPFIVNIHNWRKLNSLKTRNLSGLLLVPLVDGRCRGQSCSFTVTGRIVMHEPNLQHIPRDFTVNNDIYSLRSAFIAKSGNVIVSADYSQLELRILAHFSEDPDLLRSFQNEADVFVSIAAKWNNIPLTEVSDDIRHQTKQIIYGIIYGMGDRALGEALGVDPPEAAILAAKFRQTYPGVQRFIQNCISDCRKRGFITTLTGRVRRLKGINSPNKSTKAQAERQAVNSTIQGSAADIAKSATVRIESKLKDLIPNRSPVLSPLSASHLILHLHDELMYEVSKEHVEIVTNVVKTEMSNAVKLKVPLPVVVKSGPSWGQLKKLSL